MQGNGEKMYQKETTIESTDVYNGRIISVTKNTVRLENGMLADRELVHHSGGVCVIPLDGDGNVILVRQFRYPYGEALLELPAGKLEIGETPEECGRRELLEETGTIPVQFTFLGEIYPTVAYLDERIRLFLAKGLSPAQQKLDEDEFLDVIKMPLTQAAELVMSGKIRDSKTQVGILKAVLLEQPPQPR